MGLQRWSLKFVLHISNAICVSQLASVILSSSLSPPIQSDFHDRAAKQVKHTRAEGEPMFCMQLPLYA